MLETFATTLRGLAVPRRAIPLAALAVPLLWVQARSLWSFSFLLGAVMIGLFLLVAPASYRVLFGEQARGPLVLRALVYVALGAACIYGSRWLVPRDPGIYTTFLTTQGSLVVSLGLFLVGGFGLGRDIELEARLTRERERARELEREAHHAQLLALRSHLDPHFLFNTLNAIAEWCREDGEAAERMILELSAMLRTVMEGVQTPTWPLSRDVELARALGRLHGLRDPERFVFEESIDPTLLSCPVPTMIMLPLLENAWKHGPAAGHAGPVRLEVERAGVSIRVRVTNPGAYTGRRDGGEGLRAIERRLAVAYGTAAKLDVRASGERTIAEIVLPDISLIGRFAPSRLVMIAPLRILLVDDEAIARKRLRRLVSSLPDVEIAGECERGEDAITFLAEHDVDVMILDIQMPGMSGLDTKAVLADGGPYVIFATAHPEHAVRAFDVGASDYVLKPIDALRLRVAIERARTYLERPRGAAGPARLAIETRGGVVLVPIDDVSHATFDGTLVTVHADREHITALSLSDLEKRAPDALERVHRRSLLNLAHVARLEHTPTGGYLAHTTRGATVEISRQAARRLRRRLGLRDP